MRVYRTENTLMKSNMKIDIQEELRKLGINVRRRWLHTLSNASIVLDENYKPRQDHMDLNGVYEDRNGYFHTSLGSAKGPGLFGIPEEDINCRCDVDFTL